MNILRPISTYYGGNSSKTSYNYIEMNTFSSSQNPIISITKQHVDDILKLFHKDYKSIPLFHHTSTTEYYLIKQLSEHYEDKDSEFNDTDTNALLKIIQMNLDARTNRTSFLLNDAMIDTFIDVFDLKHVVNRRVYFSLEGSGK